MISKVRPPKPTSGKKGKKRQMPIGDDVEGHTDEILALALSDDGRYLASGGRDRRVGVWDVQGDGIRWVKGFKGHRDAISVSTRCHHAGLRLIKKFSLSPFAKTRINSTRRLMTDPLSYLIFRRLSWAM